MNRRGFLGAVAVAVVLRRAPSSLIAEPTLDEIERLTWRRKFFPGWSPSVTAHAWAALEIGDIVTFKSCYFLNPPSRFVITGVVEGTIELAALESATPLLGTIPERVAGKLLRYEGALIPRRFSFPDRPLAPRLPALFK